MVVINTVPILHRMTMKNIQPLMCITQLEQIAFDFNRYSRRLSPLPILLLLRLSTQPGEWVSSRQLNVNINTTIRNDHFHWLLRADLVEKKVEIKRENDGATRKMNYYRAINIRPVRDFDRDLVCKIYYRTITAVNLLPSRGVGILLVFLAIHFRKLALQTEMVRYMEFQHATSGDKVIRGLVECGELVIIGIGGGEHLVRQNTIYDIN